MTAYKINSDAIVLHHLVLFTLELLVETEKNNRFIKHYINLLVDSRINQYRCSSYTGTALTETGCCWTLTFLPPLGQVLVHWVQPHHL